MKRLSFLSILILLNCLCSAQTLEKIESQYYADNWVESIRKAQTLNIRWKISSFEEGLSQSMVSLRIKRPDLYKVMVYSTDEVTTFTSYDGIMQYTYLYGPEDPFLSDVITDDNLTPDEVKAGFDDALNQTEIIGYFFALTDSLFKAKSFVLDDEPTQINNVRAWRLTASFKEDGRTVYVQAYFDEKSNHLAGLSIASGNDDYTLNRIEINTEIDDSVFRIEL